MRVLTFGTFDRLHKGHEAYLKQASAYGEVYAIVALDETVKEVKGHYPKESQGQRLQNVEKLVRKAFLGYKEDKLARIEEIQPDIIYLGYDQNVFVNGLREKLAARGLHPRILRGKAFYPEKYKSSLR